ncbi:unnamed protein product [Lactuca virosa]|uniref:Reverse transcriptase zinc-binding domain-containing protein n=1 Tax=Lactuca virosa TaxID=75947 RepID=A0AAU9LNA6_9ASTR|nr:unnamed protein product [Lactuca virosa]
MHNEEQKGDNRVSLQDHHKTHDGIRFLFVKLGLAFDLRIQMFIGTNLNVLDKWFNIIDLLKQATRGKSIWFFIHRLVLAGVVYHIWIERNNRIFKNKRRPYETMVKPITDEVRSRSMSLTLKASQNTDKAKLLWRLPMMNKDIATHHSP